MGLNDDVKNDAKKPRAKRKRAKAPAPVVPPVAPEASAEGLSITAGPDAVTIEDLSVTPPIRAHGADEAQAREAYEYQRELRGRHDAAALAASPEPQTSDLTPGRVA